jgi:hypothetical protein
MQINPSDKLLELVLTSRIIDVGAILVSVTAVIVSTRNAISSLKKDIVRLCSTVEELSRQGLHREIEIERIKARCISHRKGSTSES